MSFHSPLLQRRSRHESCGGENIRLLRCQICKPNPAEATTTDTLKQGSELALAVYAEMSPEEKALWLHLFVAHGLLARTGSLKLVEALLLDASVI